MKRLGGLAVLGLVLGGCVEPPKAVTPEVTTAPKVFATQHRPEQVLIAFREAGLEFGATSNAVLEASKSVAPDVAKFGIRFVIPMLEKSAGSGAGGRVWSFEKETDLQVMRQFYVDLADRQQRPSWLYVRDNLLLQINGKLPRKDADRFGDVFLRAELKPLPEPKDK